jgi:hypothetical protein
LDFLAFLEQAIPNPSGFDILLRLRQRSAISADGI